jgi:hypothetical protein
VKVPPNWTVWYGLLLWVYYNLLLDNYFLPVELMHFLGLHVPYTPKVAAVNKTVEICGLFVYFDWGSTRQRNVKFGRITIRQPNTALLGVGNNKLHNFAGYWLTQKDSRELQEQFGWL